MKTKTINLYEYAELSKKAKNHAYLAWKNDGMNFDAHYLQVELDNKVEELLTENGIKPIDGTYAKVWYSLSYSQGDGAMFEGKFYWKQYGVVITQVLHFIKTFLTNK